MLSAWVRPGNEYRMRSLPGVQDFSVPEPPQCLPSGGSGQAGDRIMIKTGFAGLAAICMLLLSATFALAHHPMGGALPQTLWHGLLSGIGHPVIGIGEYLPLGLHHSSLRQVWSSLSNRRLASAGPQLPAG